MKKLVIIPAYNEQESILSTVENLISEAPEFDYVIINDCSKDDIDEVMEHYSNDSRVIFIKNVPKARIQFYKLHRKNMIIFPNGFTGYYLVFISLDIHRLIPEPWLPKGLVLNPSFS